MCGTSLSFSIARWWERKKRAICKAINASGSAEALGLFLMPCIRNSNSSSYTKDQCWKWLSCQCALYVCDLLFARKSSGISYAYVQMDGSSHRKFMALYRRYVKQVIDRKWVPFFQLFSKYVFFRLPLSFYQFWVVPGLDDHVN